MYCYLSLQSRYCCTWGIWTCLGQWLPTFRRYWYVNVVAGKYTAVLTLCIAGYSLSLTYCTYQLPLSYNILLQPQSLRLQDHMRRSCCRLRSSSSSQLVIPRTRLSMHCWRPCISGGWKPPLEQSAARRHLSSNADCFPEPPQSRSFPSYLFSVSTEWTIKTWHFIFDYNFGYNLTDFYSFYIILIMKKFDMRL